MFVYQQVDLFSIWNSSITCSRVVNLASRLRAIWFGFGVAMCELVRLKVEKGKNVIYISQRFVFF